MEKTGLSFIQAPVTAPSPKPSAEIGADGVAKSFGNFLSDAIQKLEGQQMEVETLTKQFAVGDLPDVHRLTIAAEKAALGLEFTVKVRDKAIEAYQEIMRMQI
ncbi:flagellar hook-basal body complex protein FliE [Paenibacillus thermoaerophilus]|nr:flagellar hook-basal body complex protein FliE [Paenibacillus thermoaerophilus]